jgi:hypothetical protein
MLPFGEEGGKELTEADRLGVEEGLWGAEGLWFWVEGLCSGEEEELDF